MSSAYCWAWFRLAVVVAALGLWSQRYDYVECSTDDGYCMVADRWTGELGTVRSKLKR